jgi:hypothetical protein
MEYPRPKWGFRLFWISCPLCGKKLLLSMTSWPIKITSGIICIGIYNYFVFEAINLKTIGDTIPDSLFYILVFGACFLCICLGLSFSRGPGFIHPLGGKTGEPMHIIDHKCSHTSNKP